MKNKIIIAVIAITVIISALAICSSAYNVDDYDGVTIPTGTEITLSMNPNVNYLTQDTLYPLTFKSGYNFQNSYIGVKLIYVSGTKIKYMTNTSTGDTIYDGGAYYNNYNIIKLTENYTVDKNDGLSKYIINNAVSGLPDPPPPPDENIGNVLDNAKATFNTSLNVTSVIIAWLMANTLALCGLYLYILVALIGIAVRFFKK